MDKNFDSTASANHYEKARQEATQSWAQRRQAQINLAKQKGGLSLYEKIMHMPKNAWSEITTDLAESKDTNHQRPDEYRTNVYEKMLDAASGGLPASPDIEQQWHKLKNAGSY
jgi:hypothetical protein